MLFGDLQGPQGFPLVQRNTAEYAEKQRQAQATQADNPVDGVEFEGFKHPSTPSCV